MRPNFCILLSYLVPQGIATAHCVCLPGEPRPLPHYPSCCFCHSLQSSSPSSKAVAASLEAACCCLQLLAAPGLPNSLYMDEVLTAVVQLAKYQLQYNVLAFHDAQYKRLYRPSSAQGE